MLFVEVATHVHLPIMAGSGVTSSNLSDYRKAHALIVGSYFKKNGRYDYCILNIRQINHVIIICINKMERSWEQEIDVNRIQELMETVSSVRKES